MRRRRERMEVVAEALVLDGDVATPHERREREREQRAAGARASRRAPTSSADDGEPRRGDHERALVAEDLLRALRPDEAVDLRHVDEA